MKSIFIAYNHKDKVIARCIYHALSREPWDIEGFMDEFSIKPGEDIKQKCIEKAKEADLGIVILSEYTQKSEYVPQEVGILLSRNIPKIYVALHESWKIPPGYENTIKSFPLWEEKDPFEGMNKLKELVRGFLEPKEIIGAVEVLNKASRLSDEGKFEEALQYAEIAIRIDPNYDVAYIFKINTLRKLRRYDDALQTCNEALTIFPEHTRILGYRGFVFWSMKKFSEAIIDFDKVLIMTDNLDQNALFYKGRCLEEMGQLNEALNVYEDCWKIAPTTKRGKGALYRKSTLKARLKGKKGKVEEQI